jgi:hypothetical protein
MSHSAFRVAVAALALACLSPVFADEAHAAALRPTTSATAATGIHDYSWCLEYDGATDCAFSTRSQCEVTASGGLGECVHIATAAQSRDWD